MRVQSPQAVAKELTTAQVSKPKLTQQCVSDSFRRFVKDIGSVRNPEYNIDISAAIPKIADYGNIQIASTVDQTKDEQGMVIGQKVIKPTMEQLYEKLQTKIGLCLKRELIPVVIGGSRDLFQSVTDAYLAHSSAT